MRRHHALPLALTLGLALLLAATSFAATTRGIQVVAKDAAGKSASVPLYGRMTAVIIGIDVYANLPAARHLSYAVKDARGGGAGAARALRLRHHHHPL